MDPLASAKSAGLCYVTGEGPGIVRRRAGKGFTYWGVDAKPVRNKATLKRIRALVIPPAWENVWICPLENGHIQAVGRDARGRKQYRYHPRYRQVRDEAKYGRMLAFGAVLPKSAKK
jgi:DNA topoisomerase I